MYMYMTLDVSKIQPISPLNSPEICSSNRLVGYLHAHHCPKAFQIQKLESRNPDIIDKEAFFKFLVISKDITLMGRFLN